MTQLILLPGLACDHRAHAPRSEKPDMHALRSEAITLFAQGDLRDVIEPNVAFAFQREIAALLAWLQTAIAQPSMLTQRP